MLAKIKVIDFLLNLSLDKQIINEKKYYKLGNKMDDITKYIVGWVHSLKQGMVECVVLLRHDLRFCWMWLASPSASF